MDVDHTKLYDRDFREENKTNYDTSEAHKNGF